MQDSSLLYLTYWCPQNVGIFWPPPGSLVTYRNQLILFPSSAFWGPPSPSRCGRHIWKAPYVVFQCRSQKNTWVMWLMLLCTDFRGICSLLASSPCFWKYLADTPSSDAIFSWGITIHYLRSENGPPNLKIQSTLAFRYPQQNLEVREMSDCPLVCVT